jgi:hypothetical protein
MTITTADARRRLDDLGALDRDVLLPGESTNPRQGALRVVKDDSWEVRSEEYGMTTTLARASDEAEALDFVLDRVTAPLPAPLPYPRERLRQQWEAMARVFEPTAEQLRRNPSVTGELELPEGAVMDRFGTFDGFLLHPAGTPFAARSLPPDALEDRAPDHGLLTFGVIEPVKVLARLVAPAFGQPGGGVVFKLAGEDPTVRDAVRRGRLRWLQITDGEGASLE